MRRVLCCFVLCCLGLAVVPVAEPARSDEPAKGKAVPKAKTDDKPKITVIVYAILGSETSKEIPPRLVEFAKEVQRKDTKLTGFSINLRTSLDCKLGEPVDFPLIGDEKVTVTVNLDKDDNGRVTLTIKAPGMQAMKYACVCNRYLPIATDVKTKDKDRLFIAISAKQCAVEK
jgi:hypothetical protein